MFTHNEVTAGLWLVVAISSGAVGWLFARWRPSEKLLQEEYEAGHEDGYNLGYDRGWDGAEARGRLKDTYLPDRRRTVLLEPGPTIYPELAALAQMPVRGPESHAKASESTWFRTVWLDLERRYPISQDSPNGNMAEAL